MINKGVVKLCKPYIYFSCFLSDCSRAQWGLRPTPEKKFGAPEWCLENEGMQFACLVHPFYALVYWIHIQPKILLATIYAGYLQFRESNSQGDL